MKDRIKALRKDQGLTQNEFAERIGLSRNFIAQVEIGAKALSDRSVSDICRIFKVRKEWLESGEEPMRWPEPDRDEEAEIVSELLENVSDPVCTFVKEFMAVYISLDKQERETAKKIATAILEKLKNNSGSDGT